MSKNKNNLKPVSIEKFFDEFFDEEYDLENIKFSFRTKANTDLRFDFDLSFIDEEYLTNKLIENGTEIPDINSAKITFHFAGCTFNGKFTFVKNNSFNFNFDYCEFLDFSISDFKLGGKFKFRNCKFHKINFNNTSFSDLVDFWSCHFYETVIFYKTDFFGTTVFSGSSFHENVLFTYSLLDKLVIFRGTKFMKGLDLSLSIGSGHLNFFDLQLEEYATFHLDETNQEQYNEEYEESVGQKGYIPRKNIRETFRIIKTTLISQNNISESIKYRGLEKEALRSELRLKRFHAYEKTKKRWIDKPIFYIEIYLDRINLWLSKWSNAHGRSYGRALLFTVFVGFIFFYFSAISSPKYSFHMGLDVPTFEQGVGHYIQFLIPTHGFDYLGKIEPESWLFCILDFIGRLFVGYGIYQFVQAFRKYR